MNRDYYKVAIVGGSGKGKTFSFRNMNPTTTGFLNIENKPLPFPNKFKYHIRAKSTAEAKLGLKALADNPEVKAIAIDSLSAYMEILLAECRATKKNFDIWNLYNEEIGKFLTFIKNIDKEIFITAHYESLDIEGDPQKRIKVKGKEWEGLIEKEFTVVLYANDKYTKGVPEYFLNGVLEGTSAKCPPNLIGADATKIDNDVAKIYEGILKFVGEETK